MFKKMVFLWGLLGIWAFTAAANWSERSVELHSHLFMKEGMTWTFRGDFDGPLRASSWKDRFSSQANPETLDQSGIGILVVALYAHPFFTTDERESIRAQIDLAEKFVRLHPHWVIARSASEARDALQAGKKVLILSLEGAAGVLDTEADLKEFIDERGIRIVTFLHLTDDRNGGVAMLSGIKKWGNPLEALKQLFRPRRNKEGIALNSRGLSKHGQWLAAKLLERKVWIDLSHSSDESKKGLIPQLKQAGQPLLYTHGGLRRFRKSERSISDEQLQEVLQSQGIVGLGPCEDIVEDAPASRQFCPRGCTLEDCHGSVHSFALHYALAAGIVGAENVFLGSDFNGAEDHLKPACHTGTSLDGERGLWHIGQSHDVWQALRAVGAPVPPVLDRQIESFLKAWQKVAP